MFSLLKKLFNAVRDRFNPLVYGPTPIIHTTKVTYLGGYRLRLTFDTGECGTIDLSEHVAFKGFLTPLADPGVFKQVFIEHGTICWPGDISMDPIVMYHLTMNMPIELVHSESQSIGSDARTPVSVS